MKHAWVLHEGRRCHGVAHEQGLLLDDGRLLPLDGLLLSLFVGYVWSRSDALDALTNGGTLHNLACAKAILFLCRYVTPILIVIILLNGLKVF